jgi:hypothetical protein
VQPQPELHVRSWKWVVPLQLGREGEVEDCLLGLGRGCLGVAVGGFDLLPSVVEPAAVLVPTIIHLHLPTPLIASPPSFHTAHLTPARTSPPTPSRTTLPRSLNHPHSQQSQQKLNDPQWPTHIFNLKPY